MTNYNNMDVMQLWTEAEHTKNGKKLRAIHRALRKKGYSGISFFDRYPYFPLIISVIALITAYTK